MINFPILYPTRLAPGSVISDTDTRAFPIDGPGKDKSTTATSSSPRSRTRAGSASYYGVSGTDWVDAPLLANPSETRTINGRNYMLFYDGGRLRMVAFQRANATYWVNNTLLPVARRGQMLAIATSLRESAPAS